MHNGLCVLYKGRLNHGRQNWWAMQHVRGDEVHTVFRPCFYGELSTVGRIILQSIFCTCVRARARVYVSCEGVGWIQNVLRRVAVVGFCERPSFSIKVGGNFLTPEVIKTSEERICSMKLII
jgi:hypothetical protein